MDDGIFSSNVKIQHCSLRSSNSLYYTLYQLLYNDLRFHCLVDPVPELSNPCKYSVSLSCRASRGAPADVTLENPIVISTLADERATTVSMATTYISATDSSTQHVWGNFKRRSTCKRNRSY